MQLTPEILDAAARTLRMFRIGGAVIAAIPLAFALIPLFSGGRTTESAPFIVMSITLTLLVIWTNHCGERFLKGLRQGSSAGVVT